MATERTSVAFLVLDIETAVDGQLVAAIQYPGQAMTPAEAVHRYGKQRLEATGSDFIPHTYHVPISIVVGKVGHDFRLLDLAVLDEPEYRPHVMTRDLWRGWEAYGHPTLVTFNGRGFDLPVLELATFRYGLALPYWFGSAARNYEQPRNRYNVRAHIDLLELLTNFGASRFSGGLSLAATLLGKPGKMDVCGEMVQGLYDQHRLAEVSDYCRCDVLDTYFVFLRTRVLIGALEIAEEQRIVAATKAWLAEQPDPRRGFAKYLENWGDWPNPWAAAADIAVS
jgi:predicted PolB exonuclease-like 3'-5' exonuclease